MQNPKQQQSDNADSTKHDKVIFYDTKESSPNSINMQISFIDRNLFHQEKKPRSNFDFLIVEL